MHKYLKYRNKTKHLSKHEQLRLLCSYYRGENIHSLIQKYKIDISINNFNLSLYLTKTTKITCPYCKTDMYFIPPSKSKKYKKEFFCKSCYHIEGTYNCKCQNCITKKQDIAFEKQQKQQKQQIIKEYKKNKNIYLLDENKSIDISILCLKERIYLGAILRFAPPSKHCIFTLHNILHHSFAPSIIYSKKIINSLIKKGIIFEVSSIRNSIDFSLNIKNICNDHNLLLDLMYPQNISENEKIKFLQLIREIQIYETIEYFSYLAYTKFSIENMTQTCIENNFYKIFNTILNNGYSTSQLFYFVYSALRNFAADRNCRYKMSKQDSYILIYNNILNLYTKAYQEKWNIQKYNRSYNTKPSELFKLVSSNLLNIGNKLFDNAYF